MITVSVPTADNGETFAAILRDRPGAAGDVEIVVWNGHTEAPDAAGRIEVFVGQKDLPPPPREALAALPALRVVQLVTAGVEPWLPVVPDGVVLCNGRGVHGSSTAELAIAGLLALLRDLPGYLAAQAEHRWDRWDTAGLAGAAVLVLGAGDIGRRIGAIATVLDAEVTYLARTRRADVRPLADLAGLLPETRVVVLALPLTAETRGIVDADFLAALPDGAVVVNISRGGHVVTDALVAELAGGRLRAYLDVTDPEPLPVDHPLWDAPNVILTPHVGGGTVGWDSRAFSLVADQVRRLQAGEQLVNRVEDGF